MDKVSVTYEQHQHRAPLTDGEWDERWCLEFERYWEDPRRRALAAQYATEVTERKYGARPAGSPSAIGFALRIFWLVKVKGMDWKKLGLGAVGAFLVGAAAVAVPFVADGVLSRADLLAAGVAGLGALGLYLKDPNKHRGPDPRQKAQGLLGGLRKK